MEEGCIEKEKQASVIWKYKRVHLKTSVEEGGRWTSQKKFRQQAIFYCLFGSHIDSDRIFYVLPICKQAVRKCWILFRFSFIDYSFSLEPERPPSSTDVFNYWYSLLNFKLLKNFENFLSEIQGREVSNLWNVLLHFKYNINLTFRVVLTNIFYSVIRKNG